MRFGRSALGVGVYFRALPSMDVGKGRAMDGGSLEDERYPASVQLVALQVLSQWPICPAYVLQISEEVSGFCFL